MTARKARPRRVLFVVFSDTGKLNPMIPVAQVLERRGTEVAFFSCQADISSRLRRAGLQASSAVWATPPELDPPTVHSEVAPSLALTRRLRRPAWLKKWLSSVLLESLSLQVDALASFVEAFRPDVLCVDAMAYAGAVVAERLGLRWASIATSLTPVAPPGWTSPWVEGFEQISKVRAETFQRLGVPLRFRASDMESPWLNTVFTVDELAPVDNDTGLYKRVGGSAAVAKRGDENAFPWERIAGDRPIVYASFGTVTSPEPEVFRCIASALDPTEAQLIVMAKDLAAQLALPEHVIVVEYAPQLALLERASVMVTHGGYNSVSECFRASVPMLVMPLVFEQSLNAHFVAQAGAGLTLDVEDLSTAAVGEALRKMIAPDASARINADRIGRAYREKNGGEEIAVLLSTL